MRTKAPPAAKMPCRSETREATCIQCFFVLDFMYHFTCGELNHIKILKSFMSMSILAHPEPWLKQAYSEPWYIQEPDLRKKVNGYNYFRKS